MSALHELALDYRMAVSMQATHTAWVALEQYVENALLEAYADGRKDQREDDAKDYAQEQCETARSLAQMRD